MLMSVQGVITCFTRLLACLGKKSNILYIPTLPLGCLRQQEFITYFQLSE